MRPTELNIDTVPAASEEFRARNIRDREGIVQRRSVHETKCRPVRVCEKANEGREHVPERCGRLGERHSSGRRGRGDNTERGREQAGVYSASDNRGVRYVERDHSLLYGGVEDDLCGFRCVTRRTVSSATGRTSAYRARTITENIKFCQRTSDMGC